MKTTTKILIGSLFVFTIQSTAAQLKDYEDYLESIELLQHALIQQDGARISFEYKMQTGYIRGAQRGDFAISAQKRPFLYGPPDVMVRAIMRHLKSLDSYGRTLALVYEPAKFQARVWLVTPEEVIYGGFTNIIRVSNDIDNELRLTFRIAARLPVHRGDSANIIFNQEDVQETGSFMGFRQPSSAMMNIFSMELEHQ